MNHKALLILFVSSFFAAISVTAQDDNLTALDIIERADEKLKGSSSIGQIKMTIVRPEWSREMSMKSWSKGDDFSLILITSPARDKGTAFLKRSKEIWNWQPSIDRVIKLPPSMMMQSWMGSDFTNDDLVKQSSIVTDYHHSLEGRESLNDREAYKIALIPKEDAPVVWGKVITWIDVNDYMQLKTEFYDEDGYLINTMIGKNIKMMGGKLLPTVLEIIPAEEEGHKTIVEHLSLAFDEPIKESFFSLQNLKRIR